MFKRLFQVLLLGILICFPANLFADGSSGGEIQAKKFILDNGLTVVISEMPSSTTVSIFGLVKTGSVREGKYLGSGISHFMEHMLFKGTDKRGVGQIPREVQALGGEINASTSFDYTIYTLTLPQGHFDQGLDIISDMLMNSKFDPEQIKKEREVVYGEVRLYKDNPERYLSQMVFNTVYKYHPYGIPVIGYEELLRPLTREDFVDYYHTHYIPNNMVISIAGNVRSEEILPKIKDTFKNFKRQTPPLRNVSPEPPQMSMRYTEDEYPTDVTRVSMAYSGVGLLDPDMYAMDICAMILGQGESSRLYKELFVRKGLVRTVTASNFTPLDRGVFEVEMMLDENKLDQAVKAVKAEIQSIADRGVTNAELDKIKRQVLSEHVFGRLTSDVVANAGAADEAFTGDCEFSKKYVDAVKKMTSDDIKRVVQKYLVENRLSLVVLKPKKERTEANQTAVTAQAPEIQKVVFDNGLTVLLRENHAFPIIAVNFVLNGGSSQETDANNGIGMLMASTWNKGTKTRSAENISETTESHGMSIGPFSGRNSYGISIGALSQDTDLAMDLLEDLIKNPTFPEDQLVLEKQQTKTAIMNMEDSISSVASRNLRQTLFLTHPQRLEGMGTLESVDRIKRQDIIDFYQRLTVPNNMVLSVYGDINTTKILDSLKKRFGSLSRKPYQIVTSSEAPPDKTREKTIRLNKKQAMVMIGFQGVDFNSEDRYGVQVMTSILGSPFSGRIFNTVRDQFGRAYTLGGSYTPGRDVGTITFYVLTTDDSVEKVKDMLLKLINDLREKEVPAQELNEIKTYLKGSFAMDLQTDAELGFISALDELYGKGYNYYKSFDKSIDAITAADIKRLAMKYLDPNKAAIILARPTPEMAAAAAKSKQEPPVLQTPSGPSDTH